MLATNVGIYEIRECSFVVSHFLVQLAIRIWEVHYLHVYSGVIHRAKIGQGGKSLHPTDGPILYWQQRRWFSTSHELLIKKIFSSQSNAFDRTTVPMHFVNVKTLIAERTQL